MMEKVTFRCESCGSTMEFDAKEQMLKCPHCGTCTPIEDREETVIEHPLTLDARRKIRVEEKETKTIECSGCGAKIEVEQFDASVECPYCGSSYILANEQQETLIPDGVVPFRVDQKRVKELFHQWMKGRFFAPNALKSLYQRDKFLGIYLPYWTFDSKVHCSYTGRGGITRTEHYKDSEGKEQTRVVIDWYYVHGTLDHFFDDVTVPATKRFYSGFFQGIEPFAFQELKSYSKAYLSGYLAEQYSVDLEQGHKEAIKKVQQMLYQMAEQEIERRYDCADSIHISPHFSDETYKYILVPVYSTSYQFKGKQYHVLINGQNGKIKGEYPKSPVKVAIATIGIIIMLVLLYFLFSGLTNVKTEVSQQVEEIETAVVMDEGKDYDI